MKHQHLDVGAVGQHTHLLAVDDGEEVPETEEGPSRSIVLACPPPALACPPPAASMFLAAFVASSSLCHRPNEDISVFWEEKPKRFLGNDADDRGDNEMGTICRMIFSL